MNSPLDSWYHLTLKSNTNIVSSLERIVLHVSDKLEELQDGHLIEIWHYRYDNSWISFRVKTIGANVKLVESELDLLGDMICRDTRRYRINSHNDRAKKWYSGWDAVLKAHGSEQAWRDWMRSLYFLSKGAEYLMRSDVWYWQGIHQLMNMIGWQDCGLYPLLIGKLPEVLGNQEYLQFISVIASMKSDSCHFLSEGALLSSLIVPRGVEGTSGIRPVYHRSDFTED